MTKWQRTALWVAGAAGLAFALMQVTGDNPALQGLSEAQAPDRGAGSARISPSGEMRQPGGNIAAAAPDAEGVRRLGAGQGLNKDAAVSPLSTMSPPIFAVNSRGHLALNADTQNNLEKLLLQDTPEAIQTQLQEISRDLPKEAANQLKTLVGQFQQYTTALSQSIPAGDVPANEQESIALLDRLHALQVSYLGADTARALFGEDEATARQLIALMRNENPNLTMEQKAERAQEALSKLPQPPSRPGR